MSDYLNALMMDVEKRLVSRGIWNVISLCTQMFTNTIAKIASSPLGRKINSFNITNECTQVSLTKLQ